MSVGTSVPLPAYTIDPAFMARKAEELGFDSIWYAEHPVLPVNSSSQFPSGGPIPETYAHFADPFIALARASSVTSTIKLATGITLVPERNPLLLAGEIASLDRFSDGRFLFGIGAGWNREETELMCPTERKMAFFATTSYAKRTRFVYMWYRKVSVGQTPSGLPISSRQGSVSGSCKIPPPRGLPP